MPGAPVIDRWGIPAPMPHTCSSVSSLLGTPHPRPLCRRPSSGILQDAAGPLYPALSPWEVGWARLEMGREEGSRSEMTPSIMAWSLHQLLLPRGFFPGYRWTVQRGRRWAACVLPSPGSDPSSSFALCVLFVSSSPSLCHLSKS